VFLPRDAMQSAVMPQYVVRLSVHPTAHVRVSPSKNLKLMSSEIIFEVFRPVWKKTHLNLTDRA